MSTVTEAAERLNAALRTVEGLRVHGDPGANVDPPAALVGPPRLQWETVCAEPSSATFVVHVMVAMSERALGQLWDLVPRVTAAIDGLLPEVSVQTATPGVFTTGRTDLPSYDITVEVSLS
ncbi:hypothetical protein [Prauserella flavalba]|uniref:hypothetical protein n=1 Tax=Prauserella flavalba TaxID=1477506 RepID=UPI0036ECE717